MSVLRRIDQPAKLALALASIAVLVGCQTDSQEPTPSDPPASTEASATASPEPTEAGSPGLRETSVFDLEVGHCFSTDTDEILAVGVVDCAETHHYEVFALLDHPAGDADAFPGDQPLLEYADTMCQPPFEEFVGHDYQTSIWYISALRPSEETWAEGDREIVCALNQRDEAGDPLAVTGSAEGAAE